ncbi:MAG: hypothetical protein EA402_02900 [Planctomycetota bacterium]|nr:MAG: hypothetical protein EA402_02900 [Planctomycetota bacterium]
MAIRIEAQLAKKLPIPGADFSSQQAAITISAEVGHPQEVIAEAQRLYQLCEAAVDAQLRLASPPAAAVGTSLSRDRGATHPNTYRPSNGAPSRSLRGEPASSQPTRSAYRGNKPGYPSQRRGAPPPISDAQRRLLSRLLSDTPDRGQAWLGDRGIENLDGIDMAEASALIDELKGGAR